MMEPLKFAVLTLVPDNSVVVGTCTLHPPLVLEDFEHHMNSVGLSEFGEVTTRIEVPIAHFAGVDRLCWTLWDGGVRWYFDPEAHGYTYVLSA